MLYKCGMMCNCLKNKPKILIEGLTQIESFGNIQDFYDKLLAGIGMVGDFTNDGSSVTITNGSDNSRIVTIDTNPSNSSSTIYNNANIELKDVDTFQFVIDKYGNVRPEDILTEVYLKNSKKLNDRKADFAKAKLSMKLRDLKVN